MRLWIGKGKTSISWLEKADEATMTTKLTSAWDESTTVKKMSRMTDSVVGCEVATSNSPPKIEL